MTQSETTPLRHYLKKTSGAFFVIQVFLAEISFEALLLGANLEQHQGEQDCKYQQRPQVPKRNQNSCVIEVSA